MQFFMLILMVQVSFLKDEEVRRNEGKHGTKIRPSDYNFYRQGYRNFLHVTTISTEVTTICGEVARISIEGTNIFWVMWG